MNLEDIFFPPKFRVSMGRFCFRDRDRARGGGLVSMRWGWIWESIGKKFRREGEGMISSKQTKTEKYNHFPPSSPLPPLFFLLFLFLFPPITTHPAPPFFPFSLFPYLSQKKIPPGKGGIKREEYVRDISWKKDKRENEKLEDRRYIGRKITLSLFFFLSTSQFSRFSRISSPFPTSLPFFPFFLFSSENSTYPINAYNPPSMFFFSVIFINLWNIYVRGPFFEGW